MFALRPDDGRGRSHTAEFGATPVSYSLNRTGLSPIEDVVSAVQCLAH